MNIDEKMRSINRPTSPRLRRSSGLAVIALQSIVDYLRLCVSCLHTTGENQSSQPDSSGFGSFSSYFLEPRDLIALENYTQSKKINFSPSDYERKSLSNKIKIDNLRLCVSRLHTTGENQSNGLDASGFGNFFNDFLEPHALIALENYTQSKEINFSPYDSRRKSFSNKIKIDNLRLYVSPLHTTGENQSS